MPLWADKNKQYLKLRTAQLQKFALPPFLQKYQKEKGERVNMFCTWDIFIPKYRVVETPTELSSQSPTNNLDSLTNDH